MSLVTPDFGLLFWMVLIFGIVFFLLAKFGFPVITGMVDKRRERIEKSIAAAAEAEEKLASLSQEHARMVEQTRLEQGRILQEAAEARDRIVAQAKQQASDEASKILEKAKLEIATERESALKDIRKQVALLSVNVAEKIVRKDISTEAGQIDLIERLVEEASRTKPS